MSKRMYDTEIVYQRWYMDLPPRQKALWWHINATMDNAGVFEVNEKLMGVMFGDEIKRNEIFTFAGARIQPVPNHPDKGIVVDYISRMNPHGLSLSSPSQRSVIMRLKELGLSVDTLNEMSRRQVSVFEEETDEEDDTGEEETEPEKPVKRKVFKKPTVAQVAAYVKEIGAKINPQGFIDYYESHCDSKDRWMVGRRPMKDWKAAVRNWERMRKERISDGNRSKHSSNWRDGEIDASVL